MTDDNEPARPSQEAVFAAPTFFVDGNLGTATGGGVARITLAAYKLNVDREATLPSLGVYPLRIRDGKTAILIGGALAVRGLA